MKNLIVVDLDKTLIPFDSFRKYTLLWLKQIPIKISTIILLRKLKLINQTQFKKRILSLASKHHKFADLNLEIYRSITDNIDEKLIENIKKKDSKPSVYLLLSASPDVYVSRIGKYLGWEAKGSYFVAAGQFINLHGVQKIKYLQQDYPSENFNYHYAISDSDSDTQLLKLFNEYDRV
jgi:phosphoserine phosphatase